MKLSILAAVICPLVVSLAPSAAFAAPPPLRFVGSFGGLGSADGQFTSPLGIALDAATSTLFVTDFANNRVQRFGLSGNFLAKFGTAGAGAGQFNGPLGIAVADFVYVSDFVNNRVEIFQKDGSYIGQFGSMGAGNGQFDGITGVALGVGNRVYVTDRYNGRVQFFNSSGTYQGQWGTQGLSGDGVFYDPTGIVVDRTAGTVFVADRDNRRIQRFNLTGGFEGKWGSPGIGNGKFSQPTGLALDAAGRVYVADEAADEIQCFDRDGTFLWRFGSSGTAAGKFDRPFALAVSPANELYVVDANNHRVQRFAIVPPDTTAPTVKVTGPRRIANAPARLRLKGTAKDPDADGLLVRVEIRVGKRAWRPATGTTTWRYRATLRPGRNVLQVRATDDSGNVSRPIRIVATRS